MDVCIHLLTFADDTARPRHRRNQPGYVESQKKMVKFFREKCPQVKHFHIYGHEDLINSDFYKKHPEQYSGVHSIKGDRTRPIGIQSYCQGDLIYRQLLEIKDGDFLLWHDACPVELKKYIEDNSVAVCNFDKQIEYCIKNKGILVRTDPKSRPPIKVNASPQLIADLEAQAFADITTTCCSWILIQKTPQSLKVWKKISDYQAERLTQVRDNNYADTSQEVIDLILKVEGMGNFIIGKDKAIFSSF
jgi:hypothetical protein